MYDDPVEEAYPAETAPATLGAGNYPTPYDPYQRRAVLEPPRPTCSRDQHFFECRHAETCWCGRTRRLPVEVRPGL